MKKRLKIAEQILIVLIVALILPLVIAGAIIVNTNQIAVRKELITSAEIIAKSVANELIALRNFEKKNIFYTYEALKKIDKKRDKEEFISLLTSKQTGVKDIYIYQLPQNVRIETKYISASLVERCR